MSAAISTAKVPEASSFIAAPEIHTPPHQPREKEHSLHLNTWPLMVHARLPVVAYIRSEADSCLTISQGGLTSPESPYAAHPYAKSMTRHQVIDPSAHALDMTPHARMMLSV